MSHSWTVVTDEAGNFVSECVCGYSALGGFEADLSANMTEHEVA